MQNEGTTVKSKFNTLLQDLFEGSDTPHIVLECPLSDPKSTIAETGMGVTFRP